MIHLDLFSGIGGFSHSLQKKLPITKTYFSEIDKYAIANYKYNFKNSEYVGAVENVYRTGIEKPSIITFGSPCQNFSTSGDRKGIVGNQSHLIEHAIKAIEKFKPSIFIWENVKGVFLSNNGRDFWEIIKRFANIGGYTIEWQLLNSLWFLPQNRERIYLIGHLRGKSKPGVFPIPSSYTIPEKIHDKKKEKKHINTIAKGYYQLNIEASYIKDTQTSYENKSCIRFLTETELEKLQGYPINWTKYGIFDNEIKTISRTRRGQLLGNSITIDVMDVITNKIIL